VREWEMKNLVDEKQYQTKLAFMTALLSKTMKQLNDFCDLDKLGWGYPDKLTEDQVFKLNP
jgi:hypothetical protein